MERCHSLMVAALLLVSATLISLSDVTWAHDNAPPPPYKSSPKQPYNYPSKKGPALAVEGVVLCQDCRYVGTRSLKDAKPLAGAKVQLACRGIRHKTFKYRIDVTDSHGYFLIRLPYFNFEKHPPEKSCKVFLISSSNTNCKITTDINSGKWGSYIHKEKTYKDEVLYSVGPFAFAPPSCKAPPPYTSTSPPPYKH